MTTDNQALLSAIRQIVSESVSEAIVPLTERIDALTERVDALTERSQRMEAEQRDQRVILNAMSTQVGSQSLHIMRIDSLIETIDTRTNQMASDLFDVGDRLRQVEDRVRDGFHGLKQDLLIAFSDIRALRTTQNRHDKTIAALREERSSIHERLAALEGLRRTE